MQTSNLAILGESGRHPLIATQEKLVLFYWLKIKTTPLTNPLRIVYEELYRFNNADHITWCTYVCGLLISIGLDNIWTGQDMEISAENVDQLKLLFKEKIEGFYSRNWLREINNLEKHPILRTYIVFKEKFLFRKLYFMDIYEKISTCYYSFSGQFPQTWYWIRATSETIYTRGRENMQIL